jgi:hypothetical protein
LLPKAADSDLATADKVHTAFNNEWPEANAREDMKV